MHLAVAAAMACTTEPDEDRLVRLIVRTDKPVYSVAADNAATANEVGLSFPVLPGDSLVALPMDFGYVGNQSGIYRFRFEVALEPHGRHLVPEMDRVSKPFELKR
jgi:hypothetical protein